MTSFGDAILFQVLWGVLGAAGVVPVTRESFILATVLTALQGASNLPVMVWQARARLRACAPYGVVMGATGMATVPIGARLLFTGDLSALKIAVGVVFLLFSGQRLTEAAWRAGRARSGAAARDVHLVLGEGPEAGQSGQEEGKGRSAGKNAGRGEPDARSGEGRTARNGAADRELCVAQSCGAAPCAAWHVKGLAASSEFAPVEAASVGAVQEDIAVAAASTAAKAGSLRACGISLTARLAALPAISPIAPPHSVLGWLGMAGIGAGLLGSMFGTAGPPQMAAYALLRVHKDDLRAVSAVYSMLEMVARMAAYATVASSPLAATELGPMLGAVVLCSWAGFAVGTRLRSQVDTDVILRMLLGLVFCSSLILLGALDDARVGAGLLIVSLVWGGACLLLVRGVPGVAWGGVT